MEDFDFRKETTDERVLVISFDNERPMTATRVADLLRAMDSDYRNLTGRNLALGHMETGSTWLHIVEAAVLAGVIIKGTAEVAKSLEDLADFAKRIANALKPKKLAAPGRRLEGDGFVAKTIGAMSKASQQTNSKVRVRKVTVEDDRIETIDVEVTPIEVKAAAERVRKKPIAINGPDETLALDYEGMAETMRALPPPKGEGEAMIRAIVQAHVKGGFGPVLAQVANVLEREGRGDIANIIRQYLRPGPDSPFTPLLS